MSSIPNLISVQDFAEQLSKNVRFGKNKVYEMIKEPGFPSVKLGGKYVVMIDKVNEWFEKKAAIDFEDTNKGAE